MKPRPFDYYRPETTAEALDLLARHGAQARVLAGGQSLGAMMNLRLISAEALVDITRLKELDYIRLDGATVEIGAAVTQATLLAWPELEAQLPFLARALPWVGHFQTRNRGTVVGSLCHNDPSSEIPLALALLGGEVVLATRRGKRRLAAEAFQLGMLTTAREDDELAVAVRFPAGIGRRGAVFREVARRHGDFAIVAAGIVVLDDGRMRLGVGGMADTPQVLELPGSVSDDDFTAAVEGFAWQLRGFDDIHASSRYRRDLLRRLAPLLLSEVRQCAQ